MSAIPTAIASNSTPATISPGDHDHEPLRWSLKDPRRQTLWGAPAPRSWFEEGTPFTGQAVREPAFVADVTIAD